MSARAGTAFIDIQGDWSAFSRQIASQGNKLGSDLGRRLSHAATMAAKAGAVGVAGAAIFAVKKAADFESQISTLGSVADASAKQMETFRRQALKAGADTKFSALEAAQAQTELAKGGLSVTQIMKGGLKSSLALAAAGEMDLADAAAATVNAMKLFGLRGKDAMKVADGFATAANVTTADVSDFAMALTQGGAAAKAAGLDFTETTAALEALAEIGIKGSDAGTSLKTALAQLASPTNKAAGLMDQLGLKFFDADGNMKSLVDVSAMLRDKLGGLTREQRLQATTTLVGTDGMRALLALYDAGPAKITKFEKGLERQGSAAEVAKRRQDNLKGSLEQFRGSIETLAIQVGTRAIPTIRHLTDDLTHLANKAGAILDRKDLTLGEKLNKIFDVAKVDARPWVRKIETALDEANLPEKLGRAVELATPVIADAAAKAAPRAAQAFATAFLNAGPWGRLVIGGALLSKMGGLGAFTRLGRSSGTAMGAGMAPGIAASGLKGRMAGMFRAWGPALAASLAISFGPEIGKQLVDKARDARTADFNLPQTHVLHTNLLPLDKLSEWMDGMGRADQKLRVFGDHADETLKKFRDAGNTRGMAALADAARAMGREFPQAGAELSRFAATVESEIGGTVVREFRQMRKAGGKSLVDIKQITADTTFEIRQKLGYNTRVGREALAKNFRLAADAVRKSMNDGVISTKTGLAEIERLMRQSLAQFGITGEQASRYLNNQDTLTGKSLTGSSGAGKQRGGPINVGKPSGDSVPSLLERGEYVLNREAVKRVGRGVLDRINFGLAPRFQKGGAVSVPRVNVRDDLGTVSTVAQRAVDIDRAAANDVLKRARAAVAATGAASDGETSTTGLVGQVLRALAWARSHGWHGGVTSGFRSHAEQARLYALYLSGRGNLAAPPGSSSHELGQAVDVSDTEGFARAMAGAPGNARLLRLVSGEPWHFSVTGHQLGGLVGYQPGGLVGGSWMTSPWRQALMDRASGGSLGHALGSTLRKVRVGKSPKLRREAVGKLLDRIKSIDLPAKLASALKQHSGQAGIFADYADRAATLSTTDADGNTIPGAFQGKSQAQWLQDQLGELFAWRNALVRAQEWIRERREKIAAAIKQARAKLAEVAKQISSASGLRKGLAKKLADARKHPSVNRALITRLTGQIKDIDGAQKVRTRVRNALKERILPALTGKQSKLGDARTEMLSNLTDVQGLGSSMKVMKALPPMGELGGTILTVQSQIRDLTAQAPGKVTDPTTDTGTDERVGLLEQLLQQANLRTAVSERQFDVLRNMPPYGGAFKDGGVVPGPVGAPRMILAHGGETVTPPDVAGAGPRVRVVMEDHRTRVFVDDVEQAVERVTRRQARAGARALPGRGGGLTR